MTRPLTRQYYSKRDYSRLPEVEIISDDGTIKSFDIIQIYLTVMIVLLIAGHVLLSLLCGD